MNAPATRATTLRDDTAARHLRKYTNRNPIHRFTLGRFFDEVAAEISALQPRRVLEFGCGEGLFLEQLKNRGVAFPSLTGIDLRDDALEHARKLLPEYRFERADLFTYEPGEPFDLVIASQVFEHLPGPEPYLERLVKLGSRNFLFTVPWEPWFRLMNLLRGRDITRLGNHPEHVNHWNPASFSRFLAPRVRVDSIRGVFPFVIARASVIGKA
jgi:2-polyprenyl-3-methyl-5-hydroxy-6-metoxy-1,4-benzoquinol methylase